MRVGYVRVSTVDQNTVRQLDGVAVERVFTDTASGKDAARPKLNELIAFVRDGDAVTVHSMDRLARNLDDLRRLVRTLTGKGVRVEFVKENLTFTGDDSPKASPRPSNAAPTPAASLPSQPSRRAACASAPPPASGNRSWPRSSASAARPCTATCGPRPSPAEIRGA